MGLVRIDHLQPDMVLSDDVRDVTGRLLLAKNEKLKQNQIRILKIWGIAEVPVTGHTDELVEHAISINDQQLETIRENTKIRFRHVDLSHEAMRELFHLTVLYRARNHMMDDVGDHPTTVTKPQHPAKSIDLDQNLSLKDIQLPEIPSIVFELNEVIANPMASADNIAQIVNKSPGLAVRLLKIVNSPYYGFPSKIDKLSQAVTLIGTKEISALALGISIISIFRTIPKDVADMYSFLKHSFACGIISRILAAYKNLPHTEQLFVSGLLHDIGRLIIYTHFSEEAGHIIRRAGETGNPLFGEEKMYLGLDHTDIGKYLLEHWKLPYSLENNVFYHHAPSKAYDPVSAAIIHLADIIANGLGLGSSGEKFVPPLDEDAWANLDFPQSYFDIVIQQATHQLAALESCFEA